VLWRKVSLGVESEHGARFVERMLTLAGTARKRGIDLLEWLGQAMTASLTGAPAPAFRAWRQPATSKPQTTGGGLNAYVEIL